MGCGAAGDLWWKGVKDVRCIRLDLGWRVARKERNGVAAALSGGKRDRLRSGFQIAGNLTSGALLGETRVLAFPYRPCSVGGGPRAASRAAAQAQGSGAGSWPSPGRRSSFSRTWKDKPAAGEENAKAPAMAPSTGQTAAEHLSPPPPALFMGHQFKRFSHFRDGHVHWRKFLHVKQDAPRVPNVSAPAQYWQERTRDSSDGLAGAGEPSGGAEERTGESSELTVICFDIETTGFSPYNDRIIEFAARDLAGGVCSTIETLVNPGMEVQNAHVHKISSGMVNHPGVPRWREVALAIVDFVESRRIGQGEVILVAHNGKRFDVPFIMTEFYANGLSIPPYWRFADSLALARRAMKMSSAAGKASPGTELKLSKLFNYYNLPSVGDAHRAMADVNMLAHVLQMLMNDLEMSTAELLAHSFGAAEIVIKAKPSTSPAKAVFEPSPPSRNAETGWNGSRIVTNRVNWYSKSR